MQHYHSCNEYLNARVGTYEFRCRRYREVFERLIRMGLCENDIIVDIGAGRCEFGRFLREQQWNTVYIPFDGSIDGVDLNNWTPPISAAFYVAIEVIEHLDAPWWTLHALYAASTKGVAITTPNPACVDVLGMDATHKVEIWQHRLVQHGFIADAVRMFTDDREDTIIAYKPRYGEHRQRE